jgi:hypothetical protein
MQLKKNNSHYVAVISSYVALAGNLITLLGCVMLILGMVGLFDMQKFSFGLSSGIRVIGTFAIGGCLLSAIGYGVQDFMVDKTTSGDIDV